MKLGNSDLDNDGTKHLYLKRNSLLAVGGKFALPKQKLRYFAWKTRRII